MQGVKSRFLHVESSTECHFRNSKFPKFYRGAQGCPEEAGGLGQFASVPRFGAPQNALKEYKNTFFCWGGGEGPQKEI